MHDIYRHTLWLLGQHRYFLTWRAAWNIERNEWAHKRYFLYITWVSESLAVHLHCRVENCWLSPQAWALPAAHSWAALPSFLLLQALFPPWTSMNLSFGKGLFNSSHVNLILEDWELSDKVFLVILPFPRAIKISLLPVCVCRLWVQQRSKI